MFFCSSFYPTLNPPTPSCPQALQAVSSPETPVLPPGWTTRGPETFMSAAARSDVHLWHVDALVKVLKQIVNKDPPVTIT